jgi:hypothetical protein
MSPKGPQKGRGGYRMKKRFLLLTLFALILGGCALVKSYVNSIVDPQIDAMAAPYNRYIMMPLMEGIDPETDLQYKEYAQILDQALRSRGFLKSDTLDEAGVVIFVAYGIGDPQKQSYTMALPVWGQTGVSSSTSYGTVNLYKNFGTYTSTTTYTPTYGITGYVPYSYSRTEYTRFLFIEAIDLIKYRESKKIAPVWKTNVISTGSTGDLRAIFPCLARAASPYLGKDTGKTVRVLSEMK